MRIKSIELFHINIPLKFTFVTAKKSLQHREVLIIKVVDNLGLSGFGEVVSFTNPFYTNETLELSKQALLEKYLPFVLEKNIKHPFDIHAYFGLEFPMAVAGIENALLDLYAKQKSQNIISMVFKEEIADFVDVGIVFGDLNYEELLVKITENIKLGCKRFKIKIKPADGFDKLKKITKHFPHIQFLADANRSYRLEDVEEVQRLDALKLVCIEEPFAITRLEEYQNILPYLEKYHFKTPVCLDESILTMQDLEKAHELKIVQVLNVKIGRVGGIYYAQKMIEFCRKNGIHYWIGSMIESGISKILHVQLAALSDTYIAGDLSDSKRYFTKDIIIPDIHSINGKIPTPRGLGIGVEVDERAIKEYTCAAWKLE